MPPKEKEAVMCYPSIRGYDLPAIVIAVKVISTEIEAVLWKISVLLFSSTSHNFVVVFLLLGQLSCTVSNTFVTELFLSGAWKNFLCPSAPLLLTGKTSSVKCLFFFFSGNPSYMQLFTKRSHRCCHSRSKSTVGSVCQIIPLTISCASQFLDFAR